MLELNDISKSFPVNVQDRPREMLREYLQHLMLKIIFESKVNQKLVFIGGTALRIIYNTQRFSEDLDFDNKNLSLEDWDQIGNDIVKKFESLNLEVEIDTRKNKTVFHHDVKFPGLYFKYGIGKHKNEKLMIKVDSEDQGVNYDSKSALLDKFDTRSTVQTIPLDIALSQKIRAFMDREMGRDLFDISSIASWTEPNYDYLKQTIGIDNPGDLKQKILERCKDLDLKKLEARARPFIFTEEGLNHIRFFQDFIKQHEF